MPPTRSSRPFGILLLFLALAAAPAWSASLHPEPPGTGVALADPQLCARVACPDLPLVVDEQGDTITGDLGVEGALDMGGDIRFQGVSGLVFPSGRLSGDSVPNFNGQRLCLAGQGVPGCGVLGIVGTDGVVATTSSSVASVRADWTRAQQRVLGACPAGQSIRAIAQDGSVACEVDDIGVVVAGAGLALAGSTLSIAPGGVTSAMVQDGTLQPADLGFDVATQAELNALRVTSAMVQDGTLQPADLGFDVATQAELDGLDLPWARNSSVFKFPVAITGTKTVATLLLDGCPATYLVSAGGTVQDNDLAANAGSVRITVPVPLPLSDSAGIPTERWFNLNGGASASAPDFDSFQTSRIVQTLGSPVEVRLEASAVGGGYSVTRWELTALRVANDC